MALDKVMMPVLDGHPDVFDREWPLRVADIDRDGRLRLDAAARHIQDIGQDQLRQLGFEETHPLWIVRRTMVDLIRPDRVPGHAAAAPVVLGHVEPVVRDAGSHRRPQRRADRVRGVLDQHQPGDADALPHRRRLSRGPAAHHDVDRLRWKAYLKAGPRETADQIREFPIRFTDIDLFDHVNNAVYWSVVEDYLSASGDMLRGPIRVTLEHEAPVALGDKLEILAHVHPPGSTDQFGEELAKKTVTTLTYVVGDEVKAIASIFALS